MTFIRVSRTFYFAAAVAVVVPLFRLAAQDEAPETPTAATLTEEQKARAVEFMCSSSPKMREGAYAAGRKLGEEGKMVYREILNRAEAFYQGRLDAAVLEARKAGGEMDARLAELAKIREEAMAFLRTDHAKDAGKIAELDRKYAGVVSAVGKVESAVKQGGGFAVLGESIQVLAEIWVEEAWCEGKTISLREAAIQNERKAVPEDLQERVFAMKGAADAASALEDANAFNAALVWATPSQKEFAKTLNGGRYVMGLGPMFLDERLSLAARGHSEEMKKLGYFSHDSPVEGNANPSKRAANAEFEGNFRGENIYWSSGGGTPAAAYRGWWESDGHRFIMFGTGQDTLGVGLSAGATHWTMMTGRKSG